MKNFTKLVTAIAIIFAVNGASAQDKVITFEQLPTKAQTFVKTHFSAQEIAGVYEDTDFVVRKEYSVYMNDGSEIEFYGDGDWEEVKVRVGQVPSQIIPATISQYIQKQYPNTGVKEIKKKKFGYEVELLNGFDLEFNKNGKFLRIDD